MTLFRALTGCKNVPGFEDLQHVFSESVLQAEIIPLDPLTKDQAVAILMYTYNSNFFRELNKILVQRNSKCIKPWLPYLKIFTEGLKQLKQSTSKTFYRGINTNNDKLFKHYRPHYPVHWSGITSLSSNRNEAKRFTNDSGILFVIQACHYFPIQEYSHFPHEEETLLLPNSRFIVTHVVDNSPVKEVHMIQVAPRDDNKDNKLFYTYVF